MFPQPADSGLLKSIRIVSWNLNHRTRLLKLHPRLMDAISLLNPDILVLNEYVHDEISREPFIIKLNEFGLTHKVSEQKTRPPAKPGGRKRLNNQVLIASRINFQLGDLHGPSMEDHGGETNFLHAKFDNGFEIVGMRAPAYDNRPLASYWTQLEQLVESVKEREILFTGDFNADPDHNVHYAGTIFASFRNLGWQIPSPIGDWSFKSGTRIDHVLASKKIVVNSAQYITSLGDITLAGNSKYAISDHAALLVEFSHRGA